MLLEGKAGSTRLSNWQVKDNIQKIDREWEREREEALEREQGGGLTDTGKGLKQLVIVVAAGFLNGLIHHFAV